MGGRLLKRWLALPLKDAGKIKERLGIVNHLKKDSNVLEKLREGLKKMGDLERLISKVATGKINPREVIQLKNSLEAIIPIKSLISQSKNTYLKQLGQGIHSCEELRQKIKEVLFEEAPVNIAKGNTIAEGHSQELDELRNLAFSSKDYLDKMLKREMEETGISSLKIASNNVFGYYIEVRNTHKDKVPENWVPS